MEEKNKANENRSRVRDFAQDSVTQKDDHIKRIDNERFKKSEIAALAASGILLGSEKRAATIVVCDHQLICPLYELDGFEMLPISDALIRYSWFRERYFFNAIPSDLNDIVANCANEKNPLGFFIRVHQGAKVEMPCQAAMYMTKNHISQIVHNIVVLEEGSELKLISGCLNHPRVINGLHLALEEHYIGKNARLVSTMVHTWSGEMRVYPHSGTIVEGGGQFESNYISFSPAEHIVSNPQTWLNGKGASAKYTTAIIAIPGSKIETDGTVYLNAENTSAELSHRGVCTGGIMHQGGLLIGAAPCKAHVDCAGMLLDSGGKGIIESVPGLCSRHADARMSHEASIGKISPDQVEYLMSRGMEEHEAVSMLIRGFLGADIKGLGDELDARIEEMIEIAGHGC